MLRAAAARACVGCSLARVSDQRLRELERRQQETGAPEDQAAWLQERRRAGGLPLDRLELAAACGHEGARLALSDAAPPRLVPRSAYELLPTGVECLLVGLADPFPLLLERLSASYLQGAWEQACAGLRKAGLPREALAYGGIGGPLRGLLPRDHDLHASPAEGFGWTGFLTPSAEQLAELSAALAGASPRLYAAVGRQRVFRSREPLSHVGGVVAFAEWCLEDPGFPREVGGATGPLGALLVQLAAERRGQRQPPSPFSQLGARPLRELLAAWALA